MRALTDMLYGDAMRGSHEQPGKQFAKHRNADIEARAADFLQRRNFSDWSADDQAALDAGLPNRAHHMAAYWRLKAAWARTETLSALRPLNTEDVSRRLPPYLIQIAAVIAVVAIIGAVVTQYLLQPQDRIYSTPVGGHETVSFADGSQIELNTDTVLRTRMTTDQRIVWLDKGEAYFQVKHDRAHPFIVMAGDHRVTDLGHAISRAPRIRAISKWR